MIIFYFIKWFWTTYILYIHTIINNELKTTITLIFFVLFAPSSFNIILAQNFELTINTKERKNASILKTISYTHIHNNQQSLFNEIDNISKKLRFIGFINNSFNIAQNDSVFLCTYSLNNKIESVRIFYPNKVLNKKILKEISDNYSEKFFEVQIEDVEKSLKQIVSHFEQKGASFTSCSLKDLHQQKSKLLATLRINVSPKRKINKFIVKGYPNFPIKYINQFINKEPNTTFNINTLNDIDNLLIQLPFITQIKKPEVLFTKDSTTIYLYIKKKNASKLNGILGFSNNSNNNKLNFTGNLNLELNNILNKGELFKLNWTNNGENTQYLNLEIKTPYILNTKISPSGSFTIFKQDSTYTSTKSQLHLLYTINNSNSIGVTFNNENSNSTLTKQTNNLIAGFKNHFYGLNYSYKSISNIPFFNTPKFSLNFKISTGMRFSNKLSKHQNKIQLNSNYILKLNSKKSISFKNFSEILISDNTFQNELFRIGGINSIRGFNELSIFTSKYTFLNTEFHQKLNQTSHIYTVTDFAHIYDDILKSNDTIYGLGIGYILTKKQSILNLSYVLGNKINKSFLFNNSKLHVKIIYRF